MLKTIERLSDRLLNRLAPQTTAAASCPCGSYPYTGPCWHYPTHTCTGGRHRDCYCADSGRITSCSECHY